MKMSDVTIGMRLRNPKYAIIDSIWGAEIVVTEITERGFKYERVDGKTVCVHPRLGIVLGPCGEHFGHEGKTDYEEVKYNPVEEVRVREINLRMRNILEELKTLSKELQTYGRPSLIDVNLDFIDRVLKERDTDSTECV